MRFPLDKATFNETLLILTQNEVANQELITRLKNTIENALDETTDDADSRWVQEAEDILKEINRLNRDHENRRFDEKNGHVFRSVPVAEPIPAGALPAQGMRIDIAKENELNRMESSFGKEMSEKEVSSYFKENRRSKKKKVDLSEKFPFKNMTIEEIEDWEKQEDNKNDIYKIKGRIKNHATLQGYSIAPAGEGLINSFAHVVKSVCDFAETLSNKEDKIRLIELIKKHEVMPAQVIATFTTKKAK